MRNRLLVFLCGESAKQDEQCLEKVNEAFRAAIVLKIASITRTVSKNDGQAV